MSKKHTTQNGDKCAPEYAFFRPAYRNIKRGDRIRFKTQEGLQLDRKTGRLMPVIKTVTAKVNPLLIFETHVVCNYGHFGTVVNDSNFVRIV